MRLCHRGTGRFRAEFLEPASTQITCSSSGSALGIDQPREARCRTSAPGKKRSKYARRVWESTKEAACRSCSIARNRGADAAKRYESDARYRQGAADEDGVEAADDDQRGR